VLFVVNSVKLHLTALKKQVSTQNVNSSLPFGQAALTFCFMASVRCSLLLFLFSWLMTCLGTWAPAHWAGDNKKLLGWQGNLLVSA